MQNQQKKKSSFLVQAKQQGKETGEDQPLKELKKFTIELTPCQAQAIMKLLPKKYAIHVDDAPKKKGQRKKFKKQLINDQSKISEHSQQSIKKISFSDESRSEILKKNEQKEEKMQIYRESLTFCPKIIEQLIKHKSSWPFREPVDPIALNIPHYSEIIKQPMDLSTIKKKLEDQSYISSDEFHKDIQLIIRNSLTFNEESSTFLKITNDFKKYYQKLIKNPSVYKEKKQTKRKKTFIKENKIDLISMNEKRDLVRQIKQLSLEDLLLVVQIAYDGEKPSNNELNIDKLHVNKIKQIKAFLDGKSKALSSEKKRLGSDGSDSSQLDDSDE